jgi:UDP-N-acetylglucosamine transferase subunit ALG13
LILLTVGTQLPFNRLISAVDDLAIEIDEEIFGQIGDTHIQPKNFPSSPSLSPVEFDKKFQSAKIVISHAGIGTILTAKKYRRPIILFPRRSEFGEHRNDHQIDTCKQVIGTPGIYVAQDVDRLSFYMKQRDGLSIPDMGESLHRNQLINNIREYICAIKHK